VQGQRDRKSGIDSRIGDDRNLLSHVVHFQAKGQS
jgi:hypothetical protein